MHLNQVPPIPFADIACMHSYTMEQQGYINLLEQNEVLQRIDTVFEKSGLIEFFKKSRNQRINIVSFGAGESPELSLIESHAKRIGFGYRYFALDNLQVFHYLRNKNSNPSATFHIVDSSDVACIQREIPILEEGSIDVVLLLAPDIEDEPYPFWKMFLDVIPRLSKPGGMIISSFLQHSEVVKFHEYTQAAAIRRIYSAIVSQQTVPIDRYLFASQHQWYAVLTLQPDSRQYVLSSSQGKPDDPLSQLFCQIVAAPTGSCYTLSSLSELKEERIRKKVEEATNESRRLQEHTRRERNNERPPRQMFIYENQPGAK